MPCCRCPLNPKLLVKTNLRCACHPLLWCRKLFVCVQDALQLAELGSEAANHHQTDWLWMQKAIQHAEQGWRTAELEAVAVHEQLAEAARAQQGLLALLAAAQQECASMHARLQVGELMFLTHSK